MGGFKDLHDEVQIVLPICHVLALPAAKLSRYNGPDQDHFAEVAGMTLAIELDRTSRVPIYQQIAGHIKELIGTGNLPAGARLPTIRRLADQLGVTRLTVQTAYAELQSGGWIEATIGRGTFVSAQTQAVPSFAAGTPNVTPAAVIGDILQIGHGRTRQSLASASPDPLLFPADEFWACLADLRKQAAAMAGYGPAQGDVQLRVALADHLRDRAIQASPGDILVTSGVTQGLALAAAALAQPGDVVLVEQPTYIGFLHQLRMAGLQAVSVPLDADGIRLDVLDKLAAQARPRFLYTIPTFQNPTGVCTSLQHRRQLLMLAKTHGFYVVEDDLYAAIAYDAPAPPALKALDDQDRVVYISSFSKSLMPGLRLGFLLAPPALQDKVLSLRLAADLVSPSLTQRALAAFLQSGGLRRHLRRVLPIYCERRDALVAAMQANLPPVAHWTCPAGGFCTWLTLPRHHGLTDVVRLMLQQGWEIAPGDVFLAQPSSDQHVRLCFGNLPAEALGRSMRALGQIVREQLATPSPAIQDGGEFAPLV
jgi:DNA-binding transcriptional MocR family regulator